MTPIRISPFNAPFKSQPQTTSPSIAVNVKNIKMNTPKSMSETMTNEEIETKIFIENQLLNRGKTLQIIVEHNLIL